MVTKVNWILEKYLFDEYEDRFVKAIRDSGHSVDIYDDSMSRFETVEDYVKAKYTQEDIVMMHGSLQMGRRMLRTSSYPGVFLTLENYECYNYYGYFGDRLLNSDYIMMGLNDILRNRDNLFKVFNTDALFIRPSNGYKSFPGQFLYKENFDSEFDILTKSYSGLDMNTLCVLSPKQEIAEEYRFIVVNGKVISGALYMDENNRKEWKAYYDKSYTHGLAFSFAEHMLEIYQPDKAYTIDVCKMKAGGYRLIELNSLCCASWYGNNCDAVIKALNELCINEYNDVYE